MTAGSSSDYRLLDAGAGERLEQWGPYRLRRPDPRATGARALPEREWRQVEARFTSPRPAAGPAAPAANAGPGAPSRTRPAMSEAGHGQWEHAGDLPERWTIEHGGVTLIVKLAPFKHTGVFPEQAEHWRWMTRAATRATATRGRPLEILNLFAYTGGATIALAKAGHRVTHVDASKPALAWARANAAANSLPADAVRWIQDDAATFVRREIRRGRRYDAVLMDPPAFGHAPRGGVWRVDDHLAPLVHDAVALLAAPVFVLVNHYARDADARTLATLLDDAMRHARGHLEHGHLRLRTSTGAALDTGVYARWRATE